MISAGSVPRVSSESARVPADRHEFLWQAGRYDVPAEVFVRHLAGLVLEHAPTAFAASECRNRRLVRLLRAQLGSDYVVRRRHEYLCGWRRDQLRARGPMRLWSVSGVRYWMLGRRQRLFLVAAQGFASRGSGRRWRLELGHAPSGVDGGGRWRTGALPGRVEAAKQGWRAWGRRGRRYLRRHPDRYLVRMFDGNLHLGSARWDHYLAVMLDGATVWRRRPPLRGTHGGRVIDAGQVAAGEEAAVRVTSAQVLGGELPAGVDHRPVLFGLVVR